MLGWEFYAYMHVCVIYIFVVCIWNNILHFGDNDNDSDSDSCDSDSDSDNDNNNDQKTLLCHFYRPDKGTSMWYKILKINITIVASLSFMQPYNLLATVSIQFVVF